MTGSVINTTTVGWKEIDLVFGLRKRNTIAAILLWLAGIERIPSAA